MTEFAAFAAETLIPYRLRTDLIVTRTGPDDSGPPVYYAKIPSTGEIFQFGEEEHFLCRCLEEPATVESVQRRFAARFGLNLSVNQLMAFVGELRAMQLLWPLAETASHRFADAGGGGRDTNPDFATIGGHRRHAADVGRVPPRPPDPAVSPARRAARNPFAFPLFDPQRVLRVVAWLCRPLRFVVWTLIPGVLLACLVLFHNPGPFAHDLVDAVHDIRTVPMFFLGLVIVNLFSQIVQGAVATGFGARVDVFGVRLLFGFFPRFYVDREPVRTLSRRGRLWCYAAPLLARLSLFAGGTFVWISYRGTGTWWPDLALISSQLGLFVFLVTAMPLAPNDGYRWLSEYLGRPAFMNNAWTALVRTLSGRPLPEALSGIEKWALFLFASGTLIFAGLLVVPVVFYASTFLERRFSGTGVVIFLCLFGLFILWLLVGWRSLRRFRTRGGGAAAEGRGALVPVEAERGRVLPFEAQPPARWRTTAVGAPSGFPTIEAGRSRTRVFPRLFWLVVLAGLAVAAFLPYRYETGGSFTILPTSRVEVHSRIDGEVLEIFVREGDWVEEGQVLAALSTWKEERDLAVTEAKLDEARARLRRLEEGSKPEEIELAEKQVASARTKVAFSKLSAERAAILVEKGHISRQSAEDAVSEYELNKANLSVAEANLRLVRSAATESEVEALRAEVRALERETEFRRAEIERARILAPVAGRVVTKNLHFNLGKHLPLGTLFAEIEDLRLAQVEVEVPESDIAEVRIGSKVRLKAWGASETERVGTVVGIAPVTEPREYGEIVRVTTEVANDDGFLKTGMSGYGKIEGSEMPAWQAFTRLFVRFFRIEFWSWIP